MNKGPLVTICIPTNGITEWVIPVIDSIQSQKSNRNDYEIVITDNGNNPTFFDAVSEYIKRYENIVYKKTDAQGFLNQIEAFKISNGEFVKFQNHRSLLADGAIERIIRFVRDNKKDMPNVFYANNNLRFKEETREYDNFDDFMRSLSYYSSWSGGLAFWKRKVELALDKEKYDELFPHTDILFYRRNDDRYIIDNTSISKEQQIDHSKKGKYNLFYAFALHYLELINELKEEGSISEATFESIRKDNGRFIKNMYRDFVILEEPCSYDLTEAEKYISYFYDFESVKKAAIADATMVKCKKAVKKAFGINR